MKARCVGGPHDGEIVDAGGIRVLFPIMNEPKRRPVLDGPNADTFTLFPFRWTDPDCNPTFTNSVYEWSWTEGGNNVHLVYRGEE